MFDKKYFSYFTLLVKALLHCALLCITPVTVEFLQVRGGNANNSATVLAHLGFQAEFLGTIAEGQVRLQMKV